MKHRFSSLIIQFSLFIFSAILIHNNALVASPVSLRGYVKAMPSLSLDKHFGGASFSNTVHNRLNLLFDFSSNIKLIAQGRNRLFYNSMLNDFPLLGDMITNDDGLVNLSWNWHNDNGWLGNSMVDRLFINWQLGEVRVSVGRQRINWGITMVSNPNDLFNTHSFFDFDHPERPGADALRIQYFSGSLSRFELAYKPARDARNSVGAVLYSFNTGNFDIQAIAGYYQHRAALGLGWAGNINQAGFKGEATYFHHLDTPTGNQNKGTLVAALGIDYMFSNGTFVIAELLYNGGYTGMNFGNLFLSQPLQPDNIMISKYAATVVASRTFSPLLSGGLSIMAMPDNECVFISPNLKYSLATNLDVDFVGQLLLGTRSSPFYQAGSSWFLSLQYSF